MTISSESSRTTRLLHTGRPDQGWVNTPVTRASTFTYDSVAEWRATREKRDTQRVRSYGARGTDSTFALEDAIVELEQGHRARLYPTGLAAIAIAMTATLGSGDHVAITDAVYEPVRKFCAGELAKFNIEFSFYKPDGSDISDHIRPRTRLIYVESPGSLTYEMVDLPAIRRLVGDRDILIAADNTWGSGLLYTPLALGADISILAATKYIGGHSDVVMGAVAANAKAWPAIESTSIRFGQTVGADDAFLALRGIRSLQVRLRQHQDNACAVADWLKKQPAIAAVLNPALPDHPSHALWLRDCAGTNGLLSLIFRADINPDQIAHFIDALKIFRIGASWGGYESLVLPSQLDAVRTTNTQFRHGLLVRLHIGLESPADLIADLEHALEATTDM